MKILSVRSTALAFTALLLAACGKKESAAPEMAPAAEPPPAVEPAPVAKSAAAESDAAFLQETKPAPAPMDDRAAYEEWFKRHNLDLSDPQMLAGDADGDGVSNRDEFLAGTNPRDAASHPEMAAAPAGMKYKEYNEVRLPLVLESVSGAQAVIKRTDGSAARTETVHAGDALRGFPLRVTKIEERQTTDKDGAPTDRSQVLLEDTSTKERVTLVKGLPAKTSATSAVLASEDGKTVVKVHAGEVFAWPGEPAVTYRVVDLSREAIVLQDQATMKLRTVPRP